MEKIKREIVLKTGFKGAKDFDRAIKLTFAEHLLKDIIYSSFQPECVADFRISNKTSYVEVRYKYWKEMPDVILNRIASNEIFRKTYSIEKEVYEDDDMGRRILISYSIKIKEN